MTWFISNHCINWKLKQDGIFKFCLMKMCIDFPKTRLIKVYCPTNDFRGNMTWKSCIINKMHIINKFSTLVLLTLTLVSSADAVNPVYNFFPTTSCFFFSEPWQGYRKHAMGSIKIITIANHERFFCLLSPSFIRRQQLDAWKKVSWRFHFLTYFNQFMNKYETALNASHF